MRWRLGVRCGWGYLEVLVQGEMCSDDKALGWGEILNGSHILG